MTDLSGRPLLTTTQITVSQTMRSLFQYKFKPLFTPKSYIRKENFYAHPFRQLYLCYLDNSKLMVREILNPREELILESEVYEMNEIEFIGITPKREMKRPYDVLYLCTGIQRYFYNKMFNLNELRIGANIKAHLKSFENLITEVSSTIEGMTTVLFTIPVFNLLKLDMKEYNKTWTILRAKSSYYSDIVSGCSYIEFKNDFKDYPTAFYDKVSPCLNNMAKPFLEKINYCYSK